MLIHGFRGGCQLRCSALQHPLAPLAFPSLAACRPEHLTLQGFGKVLLSHPVFAEGMGIAIALAIAEGIAIAVGIAKVGRHLLTLGVTHAAQGLEDTGRAVAFVGAGQIERSLRQRVKTFR